MPGRPFGAFQSEEVTRRKFRERQLRHRDGCWEWMGALSPYGYGVITWRGKRWQAHRLSLVFSGVEPLEGKVVDHTCRNRRCVNPKHLRQVTPRENALENSVGAVAKNAAKRRCSQGHKLERREGALHRHCPVCERRWLRESKERERRGEPSRKKRTGRPPKWPSPAELLAQVEEEGPAAVARRVGVTRQAVWKRAIRARQILGAEVREAIRHANCSVDSSATI